MDRGGTKVPPPPGARGSKENRAAKRRRFAEEYMVDQNATQAAIRAGYSPRAANTKGAQLLKRKDVSNYVAKETAARAARLSVRADEFVQFLKDVVYFDARTVLNADGTVKPIGEWPDVAAKALDGFEVEEIRIGGEAAGVLKKVNFSKRLVSAALLSKTLAQFKERQEHSTDSALADALKAARERLAKP